METGVKRKSSHDQVTSSEATNGTPKRSRIVTDGWRSWEVGQVRDFLVNHDIDLEVVSAFVENGIRGRVLSDINEDTLEKMKIKKIGQRMEVLQALRPFRQTVDPQAQLFRNIADEFKVFNDPIHGHVELHPLCVAILDTPQFHRLRYIKQLGGCYYVFPGATNSRFEHSIGVSYLAGQLTRALRNRQPELDITEQDILCVEIAGLCHDLGHGPFSHMFDGQFIPQARPGLDWAHEDASVMMFDHMVDSNDLVPVFEKYGLGPADRTFVKEQIRGPLRDTKNEWKYEGRDRSKSFLYEIVANKRNGIDVDKWDYFARDCHNLGITNNFDHVRFMKFARVITVKNEKQICSRDKEVGNLYDMFATRAMLHRQVYQHKVKSIVEYMITEAFLKADHFLRFPGKDGKQFKLSETIHDPVAFTRVTDSVMQQILYSTNDELREARQVLERIERRQLYKCIGQSKPDKEFQFSQSDKKRMAEEIVGDSDILPDDLVIQIVSLDFGMKEKNPIDHVRFYMKSDPEKPIQIRKDEVSHMLPENFREQLIRVFLKKTDEDSIKKANILFDRWCREKNMRPSKSTDAMSDQLTPLVLSQSDSVASNSSQM